MHMQYIEFANFGLETYDLHNMTLRDIFVSSLQLSRNCDNES